MSSWAMFTIAELLPPEAIALVDDKLERFRDETNRRFDELRPSA